MTSLPNAVGAVYLSARGRGSAVLSEAMNSNMINVVVGLFLPAVFFGLGATGSDGRLVAGWYAALTVLSLVMALAGGGLSRLAGFVIVRASGQGPMVVELRLESYPTTAPMRHPPENRRPSQIIRIQIESVGYRAPIAPDGLGRSGCAQSKLSWARS